MTFFTTLLALQIASPVQSSAPYWQQAVAYDIRARLDEPSGVLAGTESVRYQNHSPDTLRTISFHLYLNAFRPGSRWSATDSVEGRRRFNDLKDPDFGFNHVSEVTIGGHVLTPIYPLAPDSTIVRFVLPEPLAPGGELTVTMQWDARPSTTPRRQGRQGRRFDFAQWYPRVVTYDKHGWNEHALVPAGEFYGEFGSFLVDLDLPADEVMGATGVPVCGDPGWEHAAMVPDQPIEYQRDWYGNAADAAMKTRCSAPVDQGRKRLIWYAKDVHHFAMSMNPAYKYEQGKAGKTTVHVLYQPGDEKSWGGGIAVTRTVAALTWLDQLFGSFPWPQLTNVHRIEGGGTEFPMMVHNGSAGQGLIVHEVGHNYVMGILANNEWREGYLDEGFTSFQTSWFDEAAGRGSDWHGLEEGILGLDLDGRSEPTSLQSEKYRDFATYNTMIYSRGELFYHQLRGIVGDSVMRQILRTYYDRWKLKHVDEAAFREVAEEVSHRDLSTFFAQWLHSTELYDYAVGRVKADRRAGGQADSGYVTRVEVLRKAPGMVPVTVEVISDRDTARVETDGLAEREWVEVRTEGKPKQVVLDPEIRTHDWNMLNNDRKLGFNLSPHRVNRKVDYLFTRPTARDRLTELWAPTLWYTDPGGLLAGIRVRSDYLGMFELNQLYFGYNTHIGGDDASVSDWHLFLRAGNPTWLRAPGASQTFEFLRQEGRIGARVEFAQDKLERLGTRSRTTGGVSLQWLDVYDMRYLVAGQYDDAGTLEGQLFLRSEARHGRWTVAAATSVGGGVMYSQLGPGVSTARRYDTGLYFHGTAELTARRTLGTKFRTNWRAFAGVSESGDPVVRQRQIFLAGADPYEQFRNPFLRSAGSPLAGEDFHYQTPGGAGVRGLSPLAAATQAYSLGGELEWNAFDQKGKGKLFRRIDLAAFGDAALANGDVAAVQGETGLKFAGDAGLGVRMAHRIGQTDFVTRFDVPLYVSRPELGVDGAHAGEQIRFRWVFSFEQAW
ncbi:MAG TPA: M1 family metallopeptidase [Gemmatimonadales bacterium]|nr:M1 family metallopeptidase [Gemmatimonadales bacterium]